MKHKQIIEKVINLDNPPRFGLRFVNEKEKSDIVHIGYHSPENWEPSQPDIDEWGCVWDNGEDISTLGQVKENPLADWKKFNKYNFPDPEAPGRMNEVEEFIEVNSGKYLTAALGITGFNRATFLRGMENIFIDLYTAPERVKKLMTAIIEWEVKMIKQFSDYPKIDAVWLFDDWGTQENLLINHDIWRKVFRPIYKKQFQYIHRQDLKVIFHSCGMIREIIPDLIEIGVDALNINQPKLNDLNYLENFAGEVCFLCPIDTQTTLVHGSYNEIENEARQLVEKLFIPAGGFIACVDEGAGHGGSVKPEKLQFVEKTFLELANKC